MTSVPAVIAQLKTDTGAGGVNTLTSGRIFNEQSPEVGRTYPQVVIHADDAKSQDSYAGPTGVAMQRMEIDCLASTQSAANALAKAVYNLLANPGNGGTWGGTLVQGVDFEGQDENSVAIADLGPDAQLFSVTPKFSVWFNV